jgi:hypothetical protein
MRFCWNDNWTFALWMAFAMATLPCLRLAGFMMFLLFRFLHADEVLVALSKFVWAHLGSFTFASSMVPLVFFLARGL